MKMRSQGMGVTAIAEHLPRRSHAAVNDRMLRSLRPELTKIGPITTGTPFSLEEIRLLSDLRSKNTPWLEMSRYFPDRRVTTLIRVLTRVKREMEKVKVKPAFFQPWEDDLITKSYSDDGVSVQQIVANLPHRSAHSVQPRIRGLIPSAHQKRVKGERSWTNAEIAQIMDLRTNHWSYQDIAEKLGNRTARSVSTHYLHAKWESAAILKSSSASWTEPDDEKLVNVRDSGQGWV